MACKAAEVPQTRNCGCTGVNSKFLHDGCGSQRYADDGNEIMLEQ